MWVGNTVGGELCESSCPPWVVYFRYVEHECCYYVRKLFIETFGPSSSRRKEYEDIEIWVP